MVSAVRTGHQEPACKCSDAANSEQCTVVHIIAPSVQCTSTVSQSSSHITTDLSKQPGSSVTVFFLFFLQKVGFHRKARNPFSVFYSHRKPHFH